ATASWTLRQVLEYRRARARNRLRRDGLNRRDTDQYWNSRNVRIQRGMRRAELYAPCITRRERRRCAGRAPEALGLAGLAKAPRGSSSAVAAKSALDLIQQRTRGVPLLDDFASGRFGRRA